MMKNKKFIKEYIEPIVIAILIALFIRAFIVQAFKIPSSSMEPTLLVGDHILVNKFIYGIKVLSNGQGNDARIVIRRRFSPIEVNVTVRC